MDTLSGKQDGMQTSTRLLLAVPQPNQVALSQQNDNKPVDIAQIDKLLPTHWPYLLKGTANLTSGGQQVFYEQPGTEIRAGYLQNLFDAFSDLLDIYPKLIILGGEAIPRLQTISADENHPYHSMFKFFKCGLCQL